MTFRLVRKPRSPKLQMDEIQEAVRNRLKPVADLMVRQRAAIVANWVHQPVFKSEVKVTGNSIEIVVFIENASDSLGPYGGTIGDLWQWIDETGTSPHLIEAAPGNVLVFSWGGPGSYVPKTSARPARYGGPGEVQNGQTVGLSFVHHPGFPPRRFSAAINSGIKAKLDAAVDAGYKAGFRKISS